MFNVYPRKLFWTSMTWFLTSWPPLRVVIWWTTWNRSRCPPCHACAGRISSRSWWAAFCALGCRGMPNGMPGGMPRRGSTPWKHLITHDGSMVLVYMLTWLRYIDILPSGKGLQKLLGKIHHLWMGKSTISTGPFSIANCECLPGGNI